jgi:hypothetical protein
MAVWAVPTLLAIWALIVAGRGLRRRRRHPRSISMDEWQRGLEALRPRRGRDDDDAEGR